MAPKVSLITTVFNCEAYLGQAIDSVRGQTFTDWELIIVDDGSQDASLLVATVHAAKDERITVVENPHLGRVPSLLRGMALATGELIGWVDSDDALEPSALAETVSFLDQHPECGLVYTDYLNIGPNGKVLGYGKRCRISYSSSVLLTTFMVFHFRLFRRALFAEIDQKLTPFAEDYDFCLQASEITQIRHLRKPLYRYRKHPNSLSVQHGLDQVMGSKRAIEKAIERRGLADQFALYLEIKGQFEIRSIR